MWAKNFSKIATRTEAIAWHFLCRGVLLGIGLQLDPDIRPNKAIVAGMLLSIPLMILFLPIPLLLPFGWLFVSPVWAYALADTADIVLENRAYLSLLGIAGLAAWAGERAPLLVGALVLIYAWRTVERNRDWSTARRFAIRAYQESPRKPRVRLGFAEQISGFGCERQAEEIYRALLDVNEPLAGTAAANLAQVLVKQDRLEEAADILNMSIRRWPDHAALLVNRGYFLMRLGMWGAAILEFDHALRADADLTSAYEGRAICKAKLGQDVESGLSDKQVTIGAALTGRTP